MKHLIAIIFILLIYVTSSPAQDNADNIFKNGTNLQVASKSIDKLASNEPLSSSEMDTVAYLIGYYRGIMDTNSVLDSSRLMYKLPEGTSLYQLAKVVSKYLDDNPQELSNSGAIVVFHALSKAFPPDKQNNVISDFEGLNITLVNILYIVIAFLVIIVVLLALKIGKLNTSNA